MEALCDATAFVKCSLGIVSIFWAKTGNPSAFFAFLQAGEDA